MLNTLTEIKNQVAKDAGYCDWLELLKCCLIDTIDNYADQAAERYADQLRPGNVMIVGSGQRGNKMEQYINQIAILTGRSQITYKDISELAERINRSRPPIDYEVIDDLQKQIPLQKIHIANEPERTVIPRQYHRGNNNFKK